MLPGIFARAKDACRVGDYAIVVFGDQIYPAIVGDTGPNDKVGEASLRIAQQINPLSTPYNRPVSALKVTYLIFPGTAEMTFGPPDLEKIRTRCEKLIQEIGGATVPLHRWPDLIPTPTPTPSPTPIPPSSPSATPSPNESPTASPSPAPTFAFPTPTELSSPTDSPSPMPSLIPTTSPLVSPTPSS